MKKKYIAILFVILVLLLGSCTGTTESFLQNLLPQGYGCTKLERTGVSDTSKSTPVTSPGEAFIEKHYGGNNP